MRVDRERPGGRRRLGSERIDRGGLERMAAVAEPAVVRGRTRAVRRSPGTGDELPGNRSAASEAHSRVACGESELHAARADDRPAGGAGVDRWRRLGKLRQEAILAAAPIDRAQTVDTGKAAGRVAGDENRPVG